MEFISQIPVFGGFLSTIIAFVVVLGVVVFVHEYGHYIVARWCGIHAEKFSLGFGPVIWSRTDKRGMQWQLAAIPLGGYVQFLGDRGAASETDFDALDKMSEIDIARSFPSARLHKRALTVAAGPFANFILASVIFAGLVTWQGIVIDEPTVGDLFDMPEGLYDLQVNDQILEVEGQAVSNFGDIINITNAMEFPGDMEVLVLRDNQKLLVSAPYMLIPGVHGVDPLSAASAAGLKAGDLVLEAAGQRISTFRELQAIVIESGNTEISLKVWRDGIYLDLPITPVLREYPDGEGGFTERVMIGVYGAFAFLPATETPTPWNAAYIGARQTVNYIDMSLNGIKHMFLGNLSPSNLQGPIGIAQISKESANQGLKSFITLIAIISAGIGMLNLFPIPMLDGGHLVFYLYEAVRGQPPSQKTIQAFMSIGLAMVLLLMVFATYNDLMRL
ncbi:RIP metalloprotease RseP [Rhodobacterales bacterium 52_120_T64]|nr:RIP metalloprotease RseP [Rhodobacterales bacterium 52_120_T64]